MSPLTGAELSNPRAISQFVKEGCANVASSRSSNKNERSVLKIIFFMRKITHIITVTDTDFSFYSSDTLLITGSWFARFCSIIWSVRQHSSADLSILKIWEIRIFCTNYGFLVQYGKVELVYSLFKKDKRVKKTFHKWPRPKARARKSPYHFCNEFDPFNNIKLPENYDSLLIYLILLYSQYLAYTKGNKRLNFKL